MKLYMPLIIAILGVGLVINTISAQDEIDYTEMVEDLKVMCRIIDETMDETFEKDYLKGGFFRRGGCQHLYLKGYGAVFLLDVQFPVAEKEIKVVKTEKKTNLWEKHEREVRHQSQPEEAVWVVGKNESYSKEKVDKLKEQLAYLVGEYGSRIGQLAFDDTISFVVFGYPDYTIELEVFGDAVRHAEDAVRHAGDAVHQAQEILKEEVAEIAEQTSQNGDKKVIIQKDQAIIIEEIIIEKEKDKEMKDSEPKKGERLVMNIGATRPIPPIPPTPPTPPSLPHRFHGKPATTLILTFKRSQLEGRKGADWEALLMAAEVVEY